MRWNNSTDGAACFLRLAGPHVVYGIAAFIFGEAYGGHWNGDFLCLPAGVEQTDDRISVRFPLGEHLLVAGIEHSFRGDRILVDSKDFGVLQVFLQIRLVEVSKIDTEDERCCPKGPEADLSLALDWSQPVVAAISYLDGVIVIESARTSVRLPLRHVVEAFGNIGPTGQWVAATALFAAIAFDVGANSH